MDIETPEDKTDTDYDPTDDERNYKHKLHAIPTAKELRKSARLKGEKLDLEEIKLKPKTRGAKIKKKKKKTSPTKDTPGPKKKKRKVEKKWPLVSKKNLCQLLSKSPKYIKKNTNNKDLCYILTRHFQLDVDSHGHDITDTSAKQDLLDELFKVCNIEPKFSLKYTHELHTDENDNFKLKVSLKRLKLPYYSLRTDCIWEGQAVIPNQQNAFTALFTNSHNKLYITGVFKITGVSETAHGKHCWNRMVHKCGKKGYGYLFSHLRGNEFVEYLYIVSSKRWKDMCTDPRGPKYDQKTTGYNIQTAWNWKSLQPHGCIAIILTARNSENEERITLLISKWIAHKQIDEFHFPKPSKRTEPPETTVGNTHGLQQPKNKKQKLSHNNNNTKIVYDEISGKIKEIKQHDMKEVPFKNTLDELEKDIMVEIENNNTVDNKKDDSVVQRKSLRLQKKSLLSSPLSLLKKSSKPKVQIAKHDVNNRYYIYPKKNAYTCGSLCEVRDIDLTGDWCQARVLSNDINDEGIVVSYCNGRDTLDHTRTIEWRYVHKQLRKKINDLEMVPDITKVQLELEIPADSPNADNCLLLFNFRRKFVGSDGHCLYRTLAVNMFGDEEQHLDIRRECVKVLRAYITPLSQLLHVQTPGVYGKTIDEARKYIHLYCNLHDVDKLGKFTHMEFQCEKESRGIHQLRWGGELDLIAMSLLYNICFYIAQFSATTKEINWTIIPNWVSECNNNIQRIYICRGSSDGEAEHYEPLSCLDTHEVIGYDWHQEDYWNRLSVLQMYFTLGITDPEDKEIIRKEKCEFTNQWKEPSPILSEYNSLHSEFPANLPGISNETLGKKSQDKSTTASNSISSTISTDHENNNLYKEILFTIEEDYFSGDNETHEPEKKVEGIDDQSLGDKQDDDEQMDEGSDDEKSSVSRIIKQEYISKQTHAKEPSTNKPIPNLEKNKTDAKEPSKNKTHAKKPSTNKTHAKEPSTNKTHKSM